MRLGRVRRSGKSESVNSVQFELDSIHVFYRGKIVRNHCYLPLNGFLVLCVAVKESYIRRRFDTTDVLPIQQKARLFPQERLNIFKWRSLHSFLVPSASESGPFY